MIYCGALLPIPQCCLRDVFFEAEMVVVLLITFSW